MKWGIVFATTGVFTEPDMALALAEFAEAAGFESIWGGDHVVFPLRYERKYPFSDNGRFVEVNRDSEERGSEDRAMPDPLVHFAFLAARTKRIRFGAGVIILPQRNPLVLAKQSATLDHLSGGRFMLGLGVGWNQAECEAVGVPWARRGVRCDEYVHAMRALWRDEPASYQDRKSVV